MWGLAGLPMGVGNPDFLLELAEMGDRVTVVVVAAGGESVDYGWCNVATRQHTETIVRG